MVHMEVMAGVESGQVIGGQVFGPAVYSGIGMNSLEIILAMFTLIRENMIISGVEVLV